LNLTAIFIFSPVKPKVKKKYPDWYMVEAADSIYHYTDDGFNEFARDQEDMMVFFYSPSKYRVVNMC